MLTIFKIIWNNTDLKVLHKFNIRDGKNSYDYIIRIIANIFVLLFFILILVVFIADLYHVLDKIKVINERTIFVLCVFPLMCSALGLWYAYMHMAISEIKRNYQLWCKSGSIMCDRSKYEEERY